MHDLLGDGLLTLPYLAVSATEPGSAERPSFAGRPGEGRLRCRSAAEAVLGSLLLVWTLLETRKTAKAAADGVVAAERAAKAAEAAVGVSSDTAKRQLRAYVFASEALVTRFDSGRAVVKVQIKNFG